jgi:glycosyltransferase involved in cell wall biosynthesis
MRSRTPPVRSSIDVIIPALDEEGAIGVVVRDLLREAIAREIVVVDNGSSDRTAEVAGAAGAIVVREPKRGYGRACLRGIGYLRSESPHGPPGIVVFSDGDGSNDAADLAKLVAPIEAGEAEMVIGSRARLSEKGSLTIPQRAGSVLASRLLELFYGMHYTDLGPYRAIAWPALERLDMSDEDYGWTVEMQIKAAKMHLPVREIDVANHLRIAGESKVGGTVRGVIGASQKILRTIFKYR